MTAAPAEKVNFAIRPMRETDTAFVFATFLKSYRESDHVEGIGNDAFYAHFKAEFANVLKHFTIEVAHPEGDEDEIAGWIAYRARVVAYVYTKKVPWRRCGVARLLYEHAGWPTWALYASGRVLRWVRERGTDIEMVPHAEAVRMLMGVT